MTGGRKRATTQLEITEIMNRSRNNEMTALNKAKIKIGPGENEGAMNVDGARIPRNLTLSLLNL